VCVCVCLCVCVCVCVILAGLLQHLNAPAKRSAFEVALFISIYRLGQEQGGGVWVL
jgi:hypothetical protein